MFLKKEKGRPRSCSTTARIKVDETFLEWLNETQCVKQRVIFFPTTLQRQDGSTEPMPKDRGAEQGDVHGLLKVSLALGMAAARTRLRERFQTRRSLPAPNQFSGTLRTNQGVWITVKVLWAQHFGSVAAKLLAHVSSHQAMGDGYPYKASQGSSAPPSHSLVNACIGRKMLCRKHYWSSQTAKSHLQIVGLDMNPSPSAQNTSFRQRSQ